MLFMQYRRSRQFKTMSFAQYLVSIGFTNPAEGLVGMDDSARFRAAPAGLELIDLPTQAVIGEVRIKVLLADFSDRHGTLPAKHYEDLLFSQGVYPSGSVRDYYEEVSLGKVHVTGSVHGWLRMPKPYSYYTNGTSGTRWGDYPHNAPRLAEDAVKAAKAAGIKFEAGLDKFGQGIVTALIVVHAGRGAEVMPPNLRGGEIWSHKWQLRSPVNVAPGLDATIYLTVPNDCKVGVCAHELGHLAFQWQDFYDPNYDEDGMEWDGSGVWDLMAGGSYNGNGARPAHPAGLHKLQHGWIKARTLIKSGSLTLRPYTSTYGRVARIKSPAFGPNQYLLLENRKRSGFDFSLPGEGLLVWRVDEAGQQETPNTPGLFLVQADGRNDLNDPNDWNQGDAGDPFPGSAGKKVLSDVGDTSTSFPGQRSGISLRAITRDAKGVIRLQVKIAAVAPSRVAPKKKRVPKPPPRPGRRGTGQRR
jgi:immune inhibitor A